MAKLPAIISVHVQFPKNVIPNTELDLDQSNWEWNKSLAFPVSKLKNLRFSLKPYKWIRYATGIVIGARGELCAERELPTGNPVPIDYDSGLSAVSVDLYYHTTDQEKRRIFPIDPNLADTSTVTSSRTSTSTRRENFRGDVEGRDRSCVLTGDPCYLCDTAHLLPHSKGDTYIETFLTHQCRDSDGDGDIVRDIDDVRNGLLLNALSHRALGKDLAFLKTPNFAMDTADVDLNADSAQIRFTSHVFDQSISLAKHSGSALRVPSDRSNWPPAALFDAVYASVVLHHFGCAVTDILRKWGDVFYPGGTTKAAHADDKRRRDQDDADEENLHDSINPHDVVMMYRFRAMEPEKVRAYLEGCGEMVAAGKRKGLEESVNSWRESLQPPTANDRILCSGFHAAHGPVRSDL